MFDLGGVGIVCNYDYSIKVVKNDKVVLKLGNHNVNYDNYLWDALEALIEMFKTKDQKEWTNIIEEELYLKDIKTFDNSDIDDFNGVINLDNNTITLPRLDIVELKNLDYSNYPMDLYEKDGKLIASYDEEYEEEVPHITCGILDIIFKDIVTFEEFILVKKFVDEYQAKNINLAIINSKYLLFLNNL